MRLDVVPPNIRGRGHAPTTCLRLRLYRTIVDQASADVPSTDLANEISSDQSESQKVREIAVNWGIAKSVMETNPFAHAGYKLASQIARLDAILIDELAAELVQKGDLGQARLDAWYAAHALPLPLTELVESGRY